MSPTIYDIARVAGISKSTVSRVLNKQASISPEAHERVLWVIEELQYQPDKLACALTSSGFDAIMVVSTRPTKTTTGNPFFSKVLHAITAKAEEEGFDVILQVSHNLTEDLHKCGSKVKQRMIRGIVMLSSPTDESFFAQLDKCDIPVVVIGKVGGQYSHVYSVDTDNYGDSIALTDALIESGHENIACLHTPLDVHVLVDQVNGYKQSLATHNIAVRGEWIVDGGYTHETTLKAAQELLNQSSLPEAVFATDSLKLMGICRAAAEENIAIPQQLAMMGYSNEALSFILTSAPSGIDVSTQELGQRSCELLFQLIAGKPSPQNITVTTHMLLK